MHHSFGQLIQTLVYELHHALSLEVSNIITNTWRHYNQMYSHNNWIWAHLMRPECWIVKIIKKTDMRPLYGNSFRHVYNPGNISRLFKRHYPNGAWQFQPKLISSIPHTYQEWNISVYIKWWLWKCSSLGIFIEERDIGRDTHSS